MWPSSVPAQSVSTVLEGWREGIDHAALFFGALGNERSDAGGDAGVLARQVVADGLPGISAVGGFEEHVARVIKDVRIHGREHQRLGAVGAVLGVAQRNRRDVLHLASGPVKLGDFGSAAAIDDIGIERIGRDVAILDHADGMPVAKRDRAVVAAARDADRAALLLSGADLIRKRIGRQSRDRAAPWAGCTRNSRSRRR